MKKKRTGIILTSLLVIAVIAVGMTLALLQTNTGTKTNTFSSNKNIDIALREEAWDGYNFEDADPGNGTIAKNENDMNLGVNQAKNYLPGQIIPKNPQVKNTGKQDGVDAYVAIRVRYYSVSEDGVKTQMSYDTFKTTFLERTDDIDGIKFSNEWTEIQESTAEQNDQIYLYGTSETSPTVLKKNADPTSTLFTQVPLSSGLAPVAETGKLPGFAIEVQAFAIQSDNVTDVTSTMLNFVNAN